MTALWPLKPGAGWPRSSRHHNRLQCSTRVIRRIAVLGLATASCTSTTPGARRHDMSAARHAEQGDDHARAAQQHAARCDPDATTTHERCSFPVRSATAVSNDFDYGSICWTSITNPTEVHERRAGEHRRHAADHRTASSALRDAEAHACGGISPDDRDMSPFEHTDDITRVEPLIIAEADAPTKSLSERTVGAIVMPLSDTWCLRCRTVHLYQRASRQR